MGKKAIIAAVMAVLGASLLVSAAFAGSEGREGRRHAARQPHDQRLPVRRSAEVLRHRLRRGALAGVAQPLPVSGEERCRGEARLPRGRFRRFRLEGREDVHVHDPPEPEGVERQGCDRPVVRARVRARAEPEDGRRSGRPGGRRLHRRPDRRRCRRVLRRQGVVDLGPLRQGQQAHDQAPEPFPALANVMAMNWFAATDPATPYSEEDFSGTWVTAGPYSISSHDIGRSVVLERNPNYTGKRPATRTRSSSRSAGTRTRASCR